MSTCYIFVKEAIFDKIYFNFFHHQENYNGGVCVKEIRRIKFRK